ncbi:FAD-dependent thymidylate synthase [Patescibacteria group bacterium]|nr:FAD-dependent thymidylate synthase [Patescibacteria group bacterium]
MAKLTKQDKTFLKNACPIYRRPKFTKTQKLMVKPFASSVYGNPYSISMLSAETVAAICSRSSRTTGDLREIMAKEYIEPFIAQKNKHGVAMKNFVSFLNKTSMYDIFANPRAREFFIKWLAQYGDDSIAQMAGVSVVFPAISQIAIKHIENLRQGIAFLEQSTRYVDFGEKINGNYKYYTDPTLSKIGLEKEYKNAMDNLFDTYCNLKRKLEEVLAKKYPNESPKVRSAYIFDNIRALLPVSALSQMTMFTSGQALEYLIAKSLKHNLSEIKWVGLSLYNEMQKTVPSFLTRIDSDSSSKYQNYLVDKNKAIKKIVEKDFADFSKSKNEKANFKVIEYDKNVEDKIISALLFKESIQSFEEIYSKVKQLSTIKKEEILKSILSSREQRWYKLPRAFEYCNITYEMISDYGTYKDLQRHRIKSQIRSKFSPYLGYKVPPLLVEEKMEKEFISAISKVERVYKLIAKKDNDLAEYATCVAHNLRYAVNTNLRALLWEAELRTISQGHFDYRKMAQEVIIWIKKTYPLIGKYVIADMNEYTMARRGTEEQIKEKEALLKKSLG